MAIRTICIPVAAVMDGTKQEFYGDVRETLAFSVRVANLAASECMKQDDLTQKKQPKIYTYPLFVRSGMIDGCSVSIASICRAVEASYRQDRWQVMNGKRSVRSYRSQPWPLLHNKSGKTFDVEDRGEFLVARIKLLGRWWTVRLAGGSAYRDQVRGIRKALIAGSICDSKIWVDRKHKAILGICCDVPVQERVGLSGCMTVSSSREHLLVGTFERSDVPFVINADICKQWKTEADRRYQRLRQDRKSDANRRVIRRAMNAIAAKMARRMRTLCHEASARIVQKAICLRVAEIKLDLTVKSYSKSFPWFELAGKIKYKGESAGIKVVDATQSVVDPDVEKPHVYFKFAAISNRIKIGMTGREDGGRHGVETDSPEELVILAIDNQPKVKLRAREKHFHAMFQEHRVVGEWFHAEPILAWLREVDWLGNAGNLSQIMQVLDVSQDAFLVAASNANVECSESELLLGCSRNAVKEAWIVDVNQPAHAVTERSGGG